MASKSWPKRCSAKTRELRRQFGCHSDPIIYADCWPHRKRKASKRTSSSPCEGCSQAFSGSSLSAHSSSSSSTYTDAPEMPEETQTLSSSGAEFTVDVKTSNEKTPKRKSKDNPERSSKRSRGSESPHEGCSQTFIGPSSSAHTSSLRSACTDTPEMPEETQNPPLSRSSSEAEFTVDVKTSSEKMPKRKSEESPERPRKRSRGSPSPGPSHGACSSSSNSVPSNSFGFSFHESGEQVKSKFAEAFSAKYRVFEKLGQGRFGVVFAGERKKDNLPVAIKEIPVYRVRRTPMFMNGKMTMVPLEVALPMTLQSTQSETGAVVTLLDWYDLPDVLILVSERPDPCMDMFDYVYGGSDPINEDMAKIITRQLLDTLIEIDSKGVFHRDIKLDNLLIETGSDVPRVRIIDFGCGSFLETNTESNAPENLENRWLRHEPTTVWQLGLVVYEILHRASVYIETFGNTDSEVIVDSSFSSNCWDFILSCLMTDRPTLAMLNDHPWLK